MNRNLLSFLGRTWPKWMIGVCLAGHLWATCHTLPLATVWKYPVLPYNDFPVHAHRAHVFPEAFRGSGDTWGCDPASGAGNAMNPTLDVGSWLYEVPALLLPRLDTGRLVTAIAWCVALTAPLMMLAAGWLWEFDAEQIAWGLLFVCGFLWLDPTHGLFLHVGMTAFLSASYLCLFVLAVCDRLLRGPTVLSYAGTVLLASLLFLVHPCGPVAIAPAIVWLIVMAPRVHWSWRLAALAVPLLVAAVNAYWLAPVLSGLYSPLPPWRTNLNLELPYWNWKSWDDLLAHVPPLLMVALGGLATASGVGLLTASRRRSPVTIVALTLTLLVSLLLYSCGSFWHPTRVLQPVRFVLVFLNLAALLTGCAIAGVLRTLRFPWFLSSAAYAVAGAALIAAIAMFGQCLTPPPDCVALIDFVQHRTQENDRIVLEAAALRPYPFLGQFLPAITGREVISSAFPDLEDPIQFQSAQLFGHQAEDRSREPILAALARFSVNWVIVRDPPWQVFFREVTGGPGVAVGPYAAFAAGRDHSRFLIGSGEVHASVNRLELRDVKCPEDYVVLRYRYYPGWVCNAPSTIEAFPTPDNSGGLLLVRHPSPTTVLRFDPARALHTPWPAAGGAQAAPKKKPDRKVDL